MRSFHSACILGKITSMHNSLKQTSVRGEKLRSFFLTWKSANKSIETEYNANRIVTSD